MTGVAIRNLLTFNIISSKFPKSGIVSTSPKPSILSSYKRSFSSVMSSITGADITSHLPSGSWDTHVHAFDPANYPYAPSRAYSPETATYESLLAFNSSLTATHNPQNLVLVQPSPYGTDNSLVLDLLKNHANCGQHLDRQLRAITVFNESTVTSEQLCEWNALGVRGFRINTEASGKEVDYEHLKNKIQSTTDRVKAYEHWKCQLFISGESWDHLSETIRTLPVAIIADHLGGMKGVSALPANISQVTEQPGFQSLISLAKTGKVYIKISGFYRSSKLTTGGYDDLEPLIKAFAELVPDQLIWASDWPHTGSGANRTEEKKEIPESFRKVDDVAILRNIRKWVGPNVWWRMMVQTPKKVYQ